MSFFYTKSQRPTHVQALPTTKVDFLAIKVVLAITRTTTVFRNATDDFRTVCYYSIWTASQVVTSTNARLQQRVLLGEQFGISRRPRDSGVMMTCWLIIIIIIITTTIFIVLSSWPGHCDSSLGSSGECRAAPSGRRPSDQATRLGLRVRLF